MNKTSMKIEIGSSSLLFLILSAFLRRIPSKKVSLYPEQSLRDEMVIVR
jgi:hypothetical protein